MKGHLARRQLLAADTEYSGLSGVIDVLIRRVCFRALAKRIDSGLTIGKSVSSETFEIGDDIFVGEQTIRPV